MFRVLRIYFILPHTIYPVPLSRVVNIDWRKKNVLLLNVIFDVWLGVPGEAFIWLHYFWFILETIMVEFIFHSHHLVTAWRSRDSFWAFRASLTKWLDESPFDVHSVVCLFFCIRLWPEMHSYWVKMWMEQNIGGWSLMKTFGFMDHLVTFNIKIH